MFTKSLVLILCLAGCKSREILPQLPEPKASAPIILPAQNEDEVQEWMSQRLSPAVIRQKYSSLQHDAREKWNRDERNKRTHYNQVEKSNYEAFSKALKIEREGRTTPSLIADQGLRRKEYFEKEHADRLQFDSEMRAQFNEFTARAEVRNKNFEMRLAEYEKGFH